MRGGPEPGGCRRLRAPQAGIKLVRLLPLQAQLPVPELGHMGILMQLHALPLQTNIQDETVHQPYIGREELAAVD